MLSVENFTTGNWQDATASERATFVQNIPVEKLLLLIKTAVHYIIPEFDNVSKLFNVQNEPDAIKYHEELVDIANSLLFAYNIRTNANLTLEGIPQFTPTELEYVERINNEVSDSTD